MVEAGEDPLFIVRRMVIFAAEDVGLADPQALNIATSCQQAVHFVGMPEGYLPMAECAAYLALAPKSNSAYTGYGAALEAARETGHLPVPNHLRNAPTALARQEGHGEDYRYPHDEPGHYAAGVEYLPRGVRGAPFFQPGETGWEARAWERLQQLRTRGASGQDEPGNHP
ncbi:MAG: hypothetical protein U5Q44_09550 [Dehalococcoidia bacterium]|nr:hypothetical protein [Dehalococcoidia bacterium]